MTLWPGSAYPPVPGIDTDLFQLSETALTPAQLKAAQLQLKAYLDYHQHYFLGFQANQKLDYEADLSSYLNIQLNNIGDPFQGGNFMLNSKWIERAVLDYFARLWHADWPHDPADGDSYWGYVVSMGGTEGNLHGLRSGRDYLAGKAGSSRASARISQQSLPSHPSKLQQGRFLQQSRSGIEPVTRDGGIEAAQRTEDNPNACTPVLFYSEDTHYSIDKIKDLLLLPTFSELGNSRYPGQSPIYGGVWPDKAPSYPDGTVHIELLVELVRFFAERGYPVVVHFNYGTTFKGGYDHVERAIDALIPVLKKNRMDERVLEVNVGGERVRSRRTGYWFHVDGALGASYMPFLEMAKEQGRFAGDIPRFDFRTGIHSIAMSSHKEIGAPWPSGVYLTKTKYLLHFLEVGYIGAQDSTLSGSRSGFSALVLWNYLAKRSHADRIDEATQLQQKTIYACQSLLQLEQHLGINLHVGHSPLALTVRFLKPIQPIVSKFSLSTEFLNGVYYAHIYLMAHVTTHRIDDLIHDLSRPGAFPGVVPRNRSFP
jgi:histidine decarboxylase